MAVVSIATLKTYFETGDFPTESQFVDLIDTLENGSTSTYKRYVALLTQTGTNAPVATILENTIGNIVWTRDGANSRFIGTLASAFILNKTFTSPINLPPNGSVGILYRNDDTTVYTGSFGDNVLSNTSIEIRVYN